MKIKNLLVSAFALTMVASCAPSEKPSGNVDEIINGFETKVNGTAKLTFNSKYKVDVISEKGGMDSFKHDIDDKVTAELDLTANDLYLYVKNDSKDGEVAKTREALVYKDGDAYKYVTSVMENPLSLASEDEAYAKIDELLAKISGNLSGYVDTKSLVFAKDGAYEHKEFGLSTTNIEVADFIGEPTITKEGNGIKVSGDLDYIGYHTDAGISDFPGKKINETSKEKASTYEITTNEKGYVTAYTQTMAAELEMQIMTPAPLVTINGTKNLSASYGESLTKKTTIDHAKTTTKLAIQDSTQGTFKTFVAPTKTGEKTPVANGADLVVGQFLVVEVTPAGSNTIKMVTFAGSSKETPEADGYFYFEIPEGKASLTVNFVGSDVIEGTKYATTAWTKTDDVTAIKLTPFTMTMDAPAPSYDDPVEVGANIVLGKFVRIEPTMAEGKELGSVKVNNKEITLNFGQYFFEAKEAITYTIVVTAKAEGEVEVAPTLSYPQAFVGGTAKVGSFTFGENGPVFTPLANGAEIPAGHFVCVVPTANEGNTVKSVLVNGKEPNNVKNGMYTFNAAAGENKVEVVFEGTLETKAITKYAPVEGVTLKITPFSIAGQGAPQYDDVVLPGAEIELGKFVQLDVTAPEGKTATISVNGKTLAPGFGGKIFFEAKVCGTYEIVITLA